MASATDSFDQSFKWSTRSLLFAGVIVKKKLYNYYINYLVENCLYYFNLMWLYFDVVGEFIWIIDRVLKGTNFQDISLMIPCSVISMLSTAKVTPLYLRRDVLKSVYSKLKAMHKDFDDIDEENDGGKVVKEIFVDAIKHFDNIKNLFVVMIVSVFIPFCFLPCLLMAVEYIETGYVDVKFPFSVEYYFDISSNYIWPFVYFHQVISTLQVSGTVYAVDIMFYGSCNFVRMHFRILRVKFEHLVTGGNTSEEQIDKFAKLVKRHQDLIEVVKNMELLYSQSALLNFVSSSFLICLSGYNVTSTEDMRAMLAFAAFLFMSLSQIAINCYGGDMIMQASKDISIAVYNCKWYISDARLKAGILVVMMRAQRPCRLTAAKFADLNLNAFATVLRRSWSYFAMLKTMFE